MPEIQEVTWLRKRLAEVLAGMVIEGIHQKPFKNLVKTGAEALEEWAGSKPALLRVENRSKYLMFEYDRGAILTHFKFSGWWQTSWAGTLPRRFVFPTDKNDPSKYSRLAFNTNKGILYYTDPRALSEVHYYHTWKDLQEKGNQRLLGPEVTSPAFTMELFVGRCQRGKRAIAEVLLDQRSFAGIGNYLRCEIMWKAGQNPFQPSSAISIPQLRLLYQSIQDVLLKAEDTEHYGHDWWEVFQKEGRQCSRCKTVITRTAVGNRGIYWCLGCQTYR